MPRRLARGMRCCLPLPGEGVQGVYGQLRQEVQQEQEVIQRTTMIKYNLLITSVFLFKVYCFLLFLNFDVTILTPHVKTRQLRVQQ